MNEAKNPSLTEGGKLYRRYAMILEQNDVDETEIKEVVEKVRVFNDGKSSKELTLALEPAGLAWANLVRAYIKFIENEDNSLLVPAQAGLIPYLHLD